SYAVSSAEPEVLNNAAVHAANFREDIRKSKDIDPSSEQQLSLLLKTFDEYYHESYTLSEEMINETIEFSGVSSRSKTMAQSLDALQEQLQTFHDKRLDLFNQAFTTASTSSEKLTSLGIILCLLTMALLFAVG